MSGTLVANFLQQRTALESEKRKSMFQIYSKAQKADDPEKAAAILDFYIEMKLIDGEKGQFKKAIKSGDIDSVLPILIRTKGRWLLQVFLLA